jgi:hypothetical protein
VAGVGAGGGVVVLALGLALEGRRDGLVDTGGGDIVNVGVGI